MNDMSTTRRPKFPSVDTIRYGVATALDTALHNPSDNSFNNGTKSFNWEDWHAAYSAIQNNLPTDALTVVEASISVMKPGAMRDTFVAVLAHKLLERAYG